MGIRSVQRPRYCGKPTCAASVRTAAVQQFLLCQPLGAIFKVVECALVMDLAMGQEKIQKAVAIFFFCLTCLMGVKNLNAMTNEGGYAKLGYHFWNHPYVSIFDQKKIEEYFGYQDRVQVIYDANIEDQELWRLEK